MRTQTDNAEVFDGGQETFPEILQRAGYATAMFGKWHLKSDPTRRQGYVTDLITDDWLSWIRGRDPTKPLCALLHHKAPHRNWMPDLKHLSMYEGEDIPVPDTFDDDYATRSEADRDQIMRIADRIQLGYDLDADPNELHNVYGDPGYDALPVELTVELEALRRRYGDTDGSDAGSSE